MSGLLRLIAWRAAAYVGAEMKSALWPVAPYLRRLGIGLSLVLGSLLAWVVALFFLLLGLFFYLGQADSYVAPALWTGLISLGIGLITVFSGLILLRRPR